jgi:hypothetical protein
MRRFAVLLAVGAMAAHMMEVAGMAWAQVADCAVGHPDCIDAPPPTPPDPPYDCDRLMTDVGPKPVVYKYNPSDGCVISDTTPTIRATVTDGDSNLRKRNIRLFFDGARVPGADFSYSRSTDELVYVRAQAVTGAGEHAVRVAAKDRDGRKGARNWAFVVEP